MFKVGIVSFLVALVISFGAPVETAHAQCGGLGAGRAPLRGLFRGLFSGRAGGCGGAQAYGGGCGGGYSAPPQSYGGCAGGNCYQPPSQGFSVAPEQQQSIILIPEQPQAVIPPMPIEEAPYALNCPDGTCQLQPTAVYKSKLIIW